LLEHLETTDSEILNQREELPLLTERRQEITHLIHYFRELVSEVNGWKGLPELSLSDRGHILFNLIGQQEEVNYTNPWMGFQSGANAWQAQWSSASQWY
jgi:hypothetical protein